MSLFWLTWMSMVLAELFIARYNFSFIVREVIKEPKLTNLSNPSGFLFNGTAQSVSKIGAAPPPILSDELFSTGADEGRSRRGQGNGQHNDR